MGKIADWKREGGHSRNNEEGSNDFLMSRGETRGQTYYNLVPTKGMLINLEKQLSSLTRRYKRERPATNFLNL